MKANIKISVIIPAYNVEKYINRSIESVLNQDYKPYEIVIIDDGSTDNTAKAIKAYNNDNITYVYQNNSGSSSARNLGIKKATGDWIAFLDSDDEWINTHLSNFVDTYNLYPMINWYGAPFKLIDENSKKELFKVKKGHIRDINIHTIFNDYMTAFPPKAYLSSPTMIIKKNIFDEIGGFDIQKKTAVDVDMWFRIALIYPKIGYTYKEGAIVYRRNMSLSTSKKWEPTKSIERFLECEALAKDISEDVLNRANPRIGYWLRKFIRAAIKNKDFKSLREVKKLFNNNISTKYKLIIFITTNFPYILKIRKKQI